jgi:phospholipid/cholesterol/gamma-HCH transport system substrate-binding protein
MTKERNAFKAGLFIIISVALIIAIIIGIEGIDNLLQPSQKRTVVFKLTDNLGGLGEGDEVRVGGVRVGKIKKIEPHDGADGQEPRLNVTISIPGNYKLREGTHIAIETSVTGASNLNISDLGQGPELDPDASLVGHPSTINELLAMGPHLKQILGKTGPAIDSATATIKQIQSKIDTAYKEYTELTDSGTKAMDEVALLFGDTRPDFRGTLKNLNASTANLKEKLPGILDSISASMTKVQTTLDQATAAMEDIKASAANTKQLTASARGVLTGNRSKFDGMIASMKTASDNLKNATAEIRRSPWRLLYKPNQGELENLVLFDSAREFAEGANDLNDAVSALRDAIHTADTPPEELQKKLEQLEQVFGKFNTVEQKLWKTVKD